jgi:predicted enzyme related to lactoylglutathione lyase
MKIKGVDYVMYYVSDLKKSIDFYKNVLGLKPFEEPGDSWAEFEVGNLMFDIGTFDKDMAGKSAGVAFAVDDIKKSVEELKKKGVKILDENWETPVCHGVTIADPDGNKINLHKRKDGTAGAE